MRTGGMGMFEIPVDAVRVTDEERREVAERTISRWIDEACTVEALRSVA